ncbi:MAG: ribonuclease Y [Bacilli bacterium]|nr:ribonuclease Y [Bacilli bacterium]
MDTLHIIFLILLIVSIAAAVGAYFFAMSKGKNIVEKKYTDLGKTAESIIDNAKKEGERRQKELISDTKKEIASLKEEYEKEVSAKKNSLQDLEKKLEQREDRLDTRSMSLDKREDALVIKENKIEETKVALEKRSDKIEELIEEQERKLLEISGLTVSEAKEIIMKKTEEEMAMEIAVYIKEEEEKAKSESVKKSQTILANAIQQYANETIQEKTVSVVSLPNDEMKGRIIGREGRNIRSIEAVTGVDLIIDDTPDSIVISCFDPIRREIARRTLEILVSDGRIQPPRIEEVFNKCQKELENEIREEGEKAVFETGIGKIHPELVKTIGKLHFRTSYGQNALAHSKEVAFLAGKLAVEIGLDEILARRAGLLHDIGKASDHEVEGSHVEIGVEIATKFRENETVIDAIASHHGDVEAKTIIAHLVAAADTLSAARPGARSESLDNYIKRLQALEELSNEFRGVDKTYALQAGREVRVLVKPEEITDAEAAKLARDIKKKIETTMNYPGTIKVTVIREVRVQEVAR